MEATNTDEPSRPTAQEAEELRHALDVAYTWPPVPTRLHDFVLASHWVESRMTRPQVECRRVFYAQCARSGEIYVELHSALYPPQIGDFINRAGAPIAQRCGWSTLNLRDSFARDSHAGRLFRELPDESLRKAVGKKARAAIGAELGSQFQSKEQADVRRHDKLTP